MSRAAFAASSAPGPSDHFIERATAPLERVRDDSQSPGSTGARFDVGEPPEPDLEIELQQMLGAVEVDGEHVGDGTR